MSVLITCEVAGDLVPAHFIAPDRVPPKPRKCQGGALVPSQLPPTLSRDESAGYIAAKMADHLACPRIANPYSLDLIDVTRSPRHRQLFPIATRHWSPSDREQLMASIYRPYREQVRSAIRFKLSQHARVVHFSIRTFDLCSNNRIRRTDVGLLYDPAVDNEVDFCIDWINEMYERAPMLRVRRNYPRRGTNDSITKAMRAEFAGQHYIGIEVALNRAWAERKVAVRDEAIDGICGALQTVITETNQSEAA